MTDDNPNLLPASTKAETALDIAGAIASLAPWIGGPVSVVLSGMSFARKLDRVRDVLMKMAQDVRDFESDVSSQYVRTEEFEDLLEQTLRKAADDRYEEKRKVYAAFLAGNIKSPGTAYDEQVRILKSLEEIQPDHIRLLKALLQEPNTSTSIYVGSIGATLQSRLPNIPLERISHLVEQLTDMRVISIPGLNTMMTGRGAEELRNTITPYGSSLLRYLMP